MPSALIPSGHSYPAFALGRTTGTPEVRFSRSSRTEENSPSSILMPTSDRDRTVSRRSKPSSRTLLTGEQPDPWNLLQLQDMTRRHRVQPTISSCTDYIFFLLSLTLYLKSRSRRLIEEFYLTVIERKLRSQDQSIRGHHGSLYLILFIINGDTKSLK